MFARIALSLLLAFSLGFSAPLSAFTFPDSKGQQHTLKAYKGKWVLVNFWATWCPPCLEEIPDLIALHEARKNKDFVVIGVAMDYQNPKQVIDFAENMFISYPIVLGTPKLAAQVGPVRGLPTTYLYNPEGKLVAHNVGPLTRAEIESFIERKTKPQAR